MHEHKDIKNWYDKSYKDGKRCSRRHTKAYEMFFRFLDVEQGKRMLDVGCGTGELLQLAFFRYRLEPHGVDISEEALKLAKNSLPEGHFSCGEAERMSYPDNTFDNITSLGVLEHLLDIGQGIREIRRVAKKYSNIILMVPNKNFIGWVAKRNKGTRQQEIKEALFSKEEWIEIITENGLIVRKLLHDRGFIYNLGDINQKWSKYYSKRLLFFATFFLPISLTYQFIFICSKNSE